MAPTGRIFCSSTPILVRAATDGAGLIHVMDVLVREHLASGMLVQMFPDWKGEERTIFAVTPRAKFASPKVRAFMQFFGNAYDGIQTEVPVRAGGIG